MIAVQCSPSRDDYEVATRLYALLTRMSIDGEEVRFWYQMGNEPKPVYPYIHGWETWNKRYDSEEGIEYVIGLLLEKKETSNLLNHYKTSIRCDPAVVE